MRSKGGLKTDKRIRARRRENGARRFSSRALPELPLDKRAPVHEVSQHAQSPGNAEQHRFHRLVSE